MVCGKGAGVEVRAVRGGGWGGEWEKRERVDITCEQNL